MEYFIAPQPPKTPRDFRALAGLLKSPTRTELNSIVGTTNSPEYVSRLRKSGWSIITERETVVDRDGQSCKIGRYRLSPKHIEFAQKAVTGLQGRKHD